MEYELRIDIADELDAFLDMSDRRRNYINNRLGEVVRELIGQEVANGLERKLLGVQVDFSRVEHEGGTELG